MLFYRETSEENKTFLELLSPASREPITLEWHPETHDIGEEILGLIRCAYKDMPNIEASLKHVHLNEIDTKSYEHLKYLCDSFNNATLVSDWPAHSV